MAPRGPADVSGRPLDVERYTSDDWIQIAGRQYQNTRNPDIVISRRQYDNNFGRFEGTGFNADSFARFNRDVRESADGPKDTGKGWSGTTFTIPAEYTGLVPLQSRLAFVIDYVRQLDLGDRSSVMVIAKGKVRRASPRSKAQPGQEGYRTIATGITSGTLRSSNTPDDFIWNTSDAGDHRMDQFSEISEIAVLWLAKAKTKRQRKGKQ